CDKGNKNIRTADISCKMTSFTAGISCKTAFPTADIPCSNLSHKITKPPNSVEFGGCTLQIWQNLAVS
ncbi:MAG TPA: hypothetical protein H9863_03920, partial [Candidatus Odoribacter faecigallinarum]|nr:hypothetical protein [Candidatus Odoribacter faecigallinarum]